MNRSVLAALLLGSVLSLAQTPSDAVYTAIRENQLSNLRKLVQEQGVNAADSRGQTPLMFAAAYGSMDAFQALLNSGTDVKAVSELGVTALHWAAGDPQKSRLLIAKGADVNALSRLGRTPLTVAASIHGASSVVSSLLAKGAQMEVLDAQGFTPLLAAAYTGESASARLLVQHGANPNAGKHFGITPLMAAAGFGDVELARMLIAKGADVNAVSDESEGKVKNGLISIGYMTALHFAAVNAGPGMVKFLLDAGAKTDTLDVRGMTPLMSAFATDRANPETVRLLLAKGSDPNIRSKAGESTYDWARKFNNPAMLPLLKLQTETPKPVLSAVTDAPNLTPRQAAERALVPVQKAADYIFKDSGCMPCHGHSVTELPVTAVRARGWRVNEEMSKLGVEAVRANFANASQQFLQGREGGGLPDSILYGMLALGVNKTAPNPNIDSVVRFLAMKQRSTGNWRTFLGSRAPMQDGDFSRTAMAIRALSLYGIPAQKAEYDRRIALAAKWLANETPFGTEPRNMQLLGLHWANAEPKLQASRLKELIAMQRSDGGWPQTPNLVSDAYATGQVLYTLHELGVPSSDAAFRKGVEFLLRTQQADGTWHVVNRALKLQPYFESGFPYEHDQWISAAGTAWAATALALSEPERANVASVR